MIVLQTPKGWTGPHVVDGLPVEGNWRSHQVPLAELAENPEHLRLLEQWLRSYRPDEIFHRRRVACRRRCAHSRRAASAA
jgi:xylulose-5-phosphate/fructose-6-phosphate phosphoketolase